MSTYAFRAVDVAGVPSRGEVDAETKAQVTEQLRERDAPERGGRERPQRQTVGHVAEQHDADGERDRGRDDVGDDERHAPAPLARARVGGAKIQGQHSQPSFPKHPRAPLQPGNCLLETGCAGCAVAALLYALVGFRCLAIPVIVGAMASLMRMKRPLASLK